MSGNDPVTTLDARFSVPDARPTPWPEARQQLGERAYGFEVAPVRAFGFRKDDQAGQTRWRWIGR
jgi:hypothetical protein